MLQKISLFKRFTVYSLIAFIITGTVLGLFISNHIKNDKIQNVKDITLLTLDTLIKPEFTPNEFEGPLSQSKVDSLNQKFDRIMKSNNIIGIKIWNKKGNILYSDNQNQIGKSLVINEDMKDALNNTLKLRISKPDEDVNTTYNEVIKIYAPIVFNGTVSGVFEVYVPYEEVKQHILMLNRTIILVMFFGLFILYLLLIKIIYNASNTLVLQNESLLIKQRELEESYLKLNSTYKNTVVTLSNAVDARDPYTAGHSARVTKISLEIGRNLGLSKQQLETLELAALFHDIGKLGVPDNVLLKPGKLTDSEFEKIKEHPTIGVNILKNIDFLSATLQVILHHHEKFAGGGYPKGIKGSDIPLESRIIAVADTYDAMTSDRPYRKGLSHNESIAEIQKYKGLQFDADVVDAFLKIDYKYLMPILSDSNNIPELISTV